MLFAMRVATFAKQTGRTVSFALAAFRQAFAAGRDLSEPDNVLIAAAACELHPNAVAKAVEHRGVKSALREATDQRRRAGRDRRPLARRRRRGLLGGRPAGGGGRGRELRSGVDGRSARRRHLLRAARADGADPPLRGGGGAPVPAGQSGRLPPPGDRRGGDDRRHHLGDARRGLPDRHLPHPRPRDRPRHRAQAGDGGAVRPGRRDQRRARRLDAHLRPRAPLHGRLRDRRRQPADRGRPRPLLRVQGRGRGHRLHVRRRRLQHRQLRRDDEPGGALAAAGLLPGREQPLRDGHLGRAPLGPDRPLQEGGGLRHPRRADRRDGRDRGARGRRRGHPPGPRGAPADPARGLHLPLPRPLRRRPRGLPRARGGRGVAARKTRSRPSRGAASRPACWASARCRRCATRPRSR